MDHERQSNIELMRILAMLMIVAHHYACYSISVPLTGENMLRLSPLLRFFGLFGQPACSLFALITGYFMTGGSHPCHYRRIVPLIAERSFYTILLLAIHCALSRALPTKGQLAACLLPYRGYNWYIQYYLLFYLFVPFLDRLARALERKRFACFLLLLLTVWSALPSLAILEPGLAPDWEFGRLGFFVVMYFIGAYIRMHVQGRVHYPNVLNLGLALGSTLIRLACVALSRASADGFLERYLLIHGYDFIFSVIFAASLFLFFLRLELSSTAVNKLARATLGIYIIHENPFMREFIWRKLWPIAPYLDAPWLHALIKIPAAFLALVLIDTLRAATVGRRFESWFVRTCYPRIDQLKAWAGRRVESLLNAQIF